MARNEFLRCLRWALPSRVAYRSVTTSRIPFWMAVLVFGCVELAGCGRAPDLKLQSISGVMPNLAFQLTDDDGKAVTATDYRHDVVLLYFGYTHCPDVCPTTLALLSGAIKDLGSEAVNVRVLFVTVDPQRDTATLLKHYMGYFGPQFIGLRGNSMQLLALAHRYHAAFQLGAHDQNGDYSVQHSSAVYIFDTNGRARLVTDATDQPQLITHDLRALIAGAT